MTRFLELVGAEGSNFGESSTSISLAGVVGIDGLLRMEALAVEGDSEWEKDRNLALLRGGMSVARTVAR